MHTAHHRIFRIYVYYVGIFLSYANKLIKTPQIDRTQLDKILGLVESGKQQGASLEFGGEQFGDKGYFMQPTVFSGVQDDMAISTDEVRVRVSVTSFLQV